MIPNFDTRSIALGDNLTTDVEFDFLITKKADILITILEDGETPIIVDGDDTTYLDDVEFDAVGGGGTVYLKEALATGRTLYIDLNVVEPVQSNLFRDRSNYSLRDFEKALDYIITSIQTVFKRVESSIKFKRHVDLSTFDVNLPDNTVGTANAYLKTNSTGTGFEFSAGIDTQAPLVVGSKGTPQNIVDTTGIEFTGLFNKNYWFIQGSGGAVNISASPRIAAGTNAGQRLVLIGCSDTNTVTLQDGNGLLLNGPITLINGSIIELLWDGLVWVELYRNGI